MKLTELIDMNKIELTREELTTILQVATGNVKDFVMDNDKFIDEQLKAINYIPCCTELKDKETENLEIKTLKDLKDAYPDGLTHMIQSENSVLKYFVDHELVKTKPLITYNGCG